MTFEEANNLSAGKMQYNVFGLTKAERICENCNHYDYCRMSDDEVIRCNFYSDKYRNDNT